MNNFNRDLQYSHDKSDAAWWEDVYRAAFYDYHSMQLIKQDGWAQRAGIDRIVNLESGKRLTIDEKVRRQDWPDIVLEYWSNYEKQIPGWIAKGLYCDYIAYAFEPSQRCYLIPYHTLRIAWKRNGKQWVKKYPKVEAKNATYTTVSVAVPIDQLMSALKDAMLITWGKVEEQS